MLFDDRESDIADEVPVEIDFSILANEGKLKSPSMSDHSQRGHDDQQPLPSNLDFLNEFAPSAPLRKASPTLSARSSVRSATPMSLPSFNPPLPTTNVPQTRDDMRLKTQLLFELNRLDPVTARKYSYRSSIDEIRFDLERIKNGLLATQAINKCRDITFFVSKGLETVNQRYNPYLNLTGWSESLLVDLMSGNYDDVFLELYQKYGKAVDPPPEVRLLFLIGSSAVMYHYVNSLSNHLQPSSAPQHDQHKDPEVNIDDIVEAIKRKKNMAEEQQQHVQQIQPQSPTPMSVRPFEVVERFEEVASPSPLPVAPKKKRAPTRRKKQDSPAKNNEALTLTLDL